MKMGLRVGEENTKQQRSDREDEKEKKQERRSVVSGCDERWTKCAPRVGCALLSQRRQRRQQRAGAVERGGGESEEEEEGAMPATAAPWASVAARAERGRQCG